MGSLAVTPAVQHGSPRDSYLRESMAWTWTGYDHDAVHRFKEENFFQTGRNLAEDRFWKTQIHGSDRRGTQSSISLGETGSGSSTGYRRYSYSEPRERSNSVISTISSRMKQFGPSRDYPYCYPEEISESGEERKAEEDDNSENPESKDVSSVEEEEGKKEDEKEEDAKEEDEVKEESPSKECGCSSGSSKERSPSPVKEEKEDKTEEDDKNYKSNSIKISTQKNHIIAEKHISSRFY